MSCETPQPTRGSSNVRGHITSRDAARPQQSPGIDTGPTGHTAGCQDKPTARATRVRGNTQSHRHRGSATLRLESSRGGSRALGSRMPRLAAGGPGLTRGSARSGHQTNRKRPGCTCGTSGPSTQRSLAAASTTSRLSRPVPPRLPRRAARPRRAQLLLRVLLQFLRRKRPSPCWERAYDLRKLVAGAEFEPATSGLMSKTGPIYTESPRPCRPACALHSGVAGSHRVSGRRCLSTTSLLHALLHRRDGPSHYSRGRHRSLSVVPRLADVKERVGGISIFKVRRAVAASGSRLELPAGNMPMRLQANISGRWHRGRGLWTHNVLAFRDSPPRGRSACCG